MNKKLKIGILGCGEFSGNFVELFRQHPYVETVVAADTDYERAMDFSKKHSVPCYHSLDEMLNAGINCVAIFTPRHTHGPIAIKALENNCHVYSAVPMASEITHCEEIIRLVREKHLTYMMGETCIYYPCSLFCKEKYENSEFGKFVYAEAQYHHDIAHFCTSHKEQISTLGVPPFFYPTHSLSMILNAVNSYVTKVTAFGYEDSEDDPYFKVGINQWDNTISNAFSLMKLANGGVIRINECRRIGWKAPSSSISSFYGTKGGYQFSNAQHIFAKHSGSQMSLEDVSSYANPAAMTENKNTDSFMERVANHEWQWDDFAPIQPRSRLPKEYELLDNGHMATHQFLIDDFCTAAYHNTLPTVNAWLAARFTIPGLVAYESVKQDGMPLDVPDFGAPPTDW